jgi:hypothetical protein
MGRDQAVTDDLEQHRIRVVPGMAAVVMGRRRQPAARQPLLPVGLALQAVTVASSAVRVVQGLAGSDLRRIRGIGLNPASRPPLHDQRAANGQHQQPEDQPGHSPGYRVRYCFHPLSP